MRADTIHFISKCRRFGDTWKYKITGGLTQEEYKNEEDTEVMTEGYECRCNST
jgi:hypothetical protein